MKCALRSRIVDICDKNVGISIGQHYIAWKLDAEHESKQKYPQICENGESLDEVKLPFFLHAFEYFVGK